MSKRSKASQRRRAQRKTGVIAAISSYLDYGGKKISAARKGVTSALRTLLGSERAVSQGRRAERGQRAASIHAAKSP